MQIITFQNLVGRTITIKVVIVISIMTTTSSLLLSSSNNGSTPANNLAAITMKRIFANKQKGPWNGRLVSRILPPNINGDYDISAKPSSSRIDPSELCPGTGPFKYKPWSFPSANITSTTIKSKEEEMPTQTKGKEHTISRSCYSDWKTIWKSQPYSSPKNNEVLSEDSCSLVLDVYLFHSDKEDLTHHIRLNRDSTESIDNTLKRLEISIAKKVLLANKKSSKSQKKMKKHKQSGRGGNQSTTKSQVWKIDDSGKDEEGQQKVSSVLGVSPWDITTFRFPTRHVLEDAKAIVVSLDNDNVCATHGGDNNEQDEGNLNTTTTSSLFDIPLQVEHCNPTLLSVKTFENFESRIFVGVPVVVEVDIVYANHVIIDWYVNKTTKVCSDSHMYIPTSQDIGKQLSIWIKPVTIETPITILSTCIEKQMRSSIHEGDGEGFEEAYEFRHVVEPLPSMPVVSPLRQGWITTPGCQTTKKGGDDIDTTPSSLRVVSYNVLADQNAYSRDESSDSVYPYCPNNFLDRARRMPMIVYELLAYQPDIICLQEVDTISFDTLLRPVLCANGYQGYYSVKQVDSSNEGCATFWSLECFERIQDEKEMNDFPIRDLFPPLPPVDEGKSGADMSSCDNKNQKANQEENTGWQSLHELSHFLSKHPHLQETVQKTLGHVLQLVTLTLKKAPNHGNTIDASQRPPKLVVANTHLFFHNWAGHIRVMQLLVSCHKLDLYRRTQDGGKKYPFVFCGDFNSAVVSGGVRLLLQRSVPPTHGRTWKHLHSFQWRKEEQEEKQDDGAASSPSSNMTVPISNDKLQSPPTLALPDTFPTLCSGYRDLPPFTHYIQGFVGTLDYILASESSSEEPFGFRPKRWAPMPSARQVKQYVALPNEGMPSDHLCLVCDLEYTFSNNK